MKNKVTIARINQWLQFNSKRGINRFRFLKLYPSPLGLYVETNFAIGIIISCFESNNKITCPYERAEEIILSNCFLPVPRIRLFFKHDIVTVNDVIESLRLIKNDPDVFNKMFEDCKSKFPKEFEKWGS
jgi:hypothetical protein